MNSTHNASKPSAEGDRLGYNPYRDSKGQFDDGLTLADITGRGFVEKGKNEKKIKKAKEKIQKELDTLKRQLPKLLDEHEALSIADMSRLTGIDRVKVFGIATDYEAKGKFVSQRQGKSRLFSLASKQEKPADNEEESVADGLKALADEARAAADQEKSPVKKAELEAQAKKAESNERMARADESRINTPNDFKDLIDNTYGRQAVFTEEESDAIASYVSTGHKDINSYLRGKIDDIWAQDKEDIKHLDSAMKNSLIEDTTLYRGIAINDVLEPGSEITDNGFTSTTLARSVADRFKVSGLMDSHKNKYVLRINANKGQKGLFPAADATDGKDIRSAEAEFILPRGTNFKVTGTEDQDGYSYVDVDIVESAPVPTALNGLDKTLSSVEAINKKIDKASNGTQMGKATAAMREAVANYLKENGGDVTEFKKLEEDWVGNDYDKFEKHVENRDHKELELMRQLQQEYYKANGITEVTLYRGIYNEQARAVKDAIAKSEPVEVSPDMAASFTGYESSAIDYADGAAYTAPDEITDSVVISMTVPVEEIVYSTEISTFYAGNGKDEYIVSKPDGYIIDPKNIEVIR